MVVTSLGDGALRSRGRWGESWDFAELEARTVSGRVCRSTRMVNGSFERQVDFLQSQFKLTFPQISKWFLHHEKQSALLRDTTPSRELRRARTVELTEKSWSDCNSVLKCRNIARTD